MITLFTTAEEAEEAFYEAVARADLDALMAVWAEDDEIVCIHPSGQRLTGVAAIRESWRSIFASNPRFTVQIKRKLRWESALLSVHSLVEVLQVASEPTPHGPMLATNVYQRGPKGWRLLARHASAAAEGSESASEGPGDSGSRPRTLH